MQLKLTTGYAIRMLAYLAEANGEIRSSAEVAEAIKVSQKYLLRISAQLRDAGMLEAHAGSGGGYRLARPAKDICLYDVVVLMEGTVKLHRCLEADHYCTQKSADTCQSLKCFAVMQEYWENFLKGLSIADLVSGLSYEELERRISGGGMCVALVSAGNTGMTACERTEGPQKWIS